MKTVYDRFICEMEAKEGENKELLLNDTKIYSKQEVDTNFGKKFAKFSFEAKTFFIFTKAEGRNTLYNILVEIEKDKFQYVLLVEITTIFAPEIPNQVASLGKNSIFKNQFKGLVDKTYLVLAKKLGSLASDSSQYINARKLWYRLTKVTNVDYIDYRGRTIETGVKPKDYNDPRYWSEDEKNNFFIIR